MLNQLDNMLTKHNLTGFGPYGYQQTHRRSPLSLADTHPQNDE